MSTETQTFPAGWYQQKRSILRGYQPSTHYYREGELRSICGRGVRSEYFEQTTFTVRCKVCEKIHAKEVRDRIEAAHEAAWQDRSDEQVARIAEQSEDPRKRERARKELELRQTLRREAGSV